MRLQRFVCWSCKEAYEVAGIFRSTECPGCEASVRTCLGCVHHDAGAPHACREPMADDVRDKDAANFCAYFKAKQEAEGARETLDDAKAKLEALFKGLGDS